MARVDLRLSDAEFYRMTPKQIVLLLNRANERHRSDLIHREMCHGNTSASIINFSPCRPTEPVKVTDFMPNYRAPKPKPMTEEEAAQRNAFNVMVEQEAQRQEQSRWQMNTPTS